MRIVESRHYIILGYDHAMSCDIHWKSCDIHWKSCDQSVIASSHPQDVLLQQQKNVSKVFLEKLQSSTAEDANSPIDIADIDTQFNFTETYPENFA